jgi:hypothetical protein
MVISRVFISRNPQFGSCPVCKKAGVLHRSRPRTMFEQIIHRITFLKNYRCKECGWRGFRSTIVITKKSLKSLSFYALLMIITALIARYILLPFVAK